jgi:hypothetical protein
MSLRVDDTPVTVAELVAAIRAQRQPLTERPVAASTLDSGTEGVAQQRAGASGNAGAARVHLGAVCVLVVGAHPGAGASLMSVALANALVHHPTQPTTRPSRGPVRLVDTAPQETSGLVCASERELGINERGCRTGRRGDVEVHRLPDDRALGGLFEVLAAFDSGSTVIDLGCPGHGLREVLEQARHWAGRVEMVVVCRASVPGTRRAEHALTELAELTGPPLVACVGARRLPGVVRASLGPRMRATSEAGRLEVVPSDRRIEVTGIDAAPLPKSIQSCGDRLADLFRSGGQAEAESQLRKASA